MSTVFAQDPPVQWAHNTGVDNDDDIALQVETDDNNDMYTIGFYEGVQDFDPGPGVNTIAANGSFVVMKKRNNGDFVWAFRLPLSFTNTDNVRMVINDDQLIIAGECELNANFDPIGGSGTTVPFNSIFLARYNTSTGALISVSHLPNTSGLYRIWDIAVDPAGDIIQVGHFQNTQDFDFSATTNSLTAVGTSSDNYIIKYDDNDNLVWAKRIGSNFNSQWKRSISISNDGKIFIAGGFFGTIDVNPDPVAVTNINSGASNGAFILRIDGNGNYVWANVIQDMLAIHAIQDIVATNTNLYVYGYHGGTTDFSLGFGVGNSTATTDRDVFIARYTVNGTYVTHKQINGVSGSFIVPEAMKRANNGDLFMIGFFRGSYDFDPNAGTQILSSVDYNWYQFALDFNLNYKWKQSIGGSDFDFIGDMALSKNGNIFLTGNITGEGDMDPSGGNLLIGSATNTTFDVAEAMYGTILPEIDVTGNSISIPNNSTTTSTTNLTDFGNLCQYGPDTAYFTVHSTGADGLLVSSVSVTGPDAADFQVSNIALNILSGGSVTLQVIALGNTPGVKNATIVIDNDDPDESTYQFAIRSNVQDQPTVTYAISPNLTTFCEGELVTFNGMGADSYVWNMGVANGVPVVIGTTGWYEVIGTDSFGCKDTNSVFVTVNPLPTVSVSSNDANDEICVNDAIQLIGSGANSYSYTGGVLDQTDFFPTATDTYTVTGTDGNGCQNTANITITVNPLPNVTVTSSDPNDEICVNDAVQLIGAGAVDYIYTGGVVDQMDFFPTTTETYVLTGTDGNGCVNTADIAITVNPLPTVTVSSNDPNDTICLNDAVQLTGAGAASYTYNAGVLDQTDFFPTSTETYVVTGTDVNGCQNTDNITIVVNPLPTVSVSSNDPNDEICVNDAIQLTGAGAVSYTYTGGVINQMDFFPTATNTYTITGTDANGCENTADIIITVNPLPTVTVTSNDPNDEICLNEAVQLIGSGATSYVYTGGVVDQTDFFPTTTDTYTLTGTDANGCVNTADITITVNALPTVTVTSTELDDTICVNDSIQLIGAGAASYSYSGGVFDQTNFAPTGTTTYFITGTDANGCQDDDSITIYVEALPTIDAGSDLFACFGDSVMLSATGSGDISWTGGQMNNTYYTPTMASEELISTATTAQGCMNSDTITVSMGAQIDNSITSNVDTAFAISGYDTYEWFDCNTNASLGSGAQHWITVGYDGDFYAVVTDNNGCTDTTDCVTIDFTHLDELSAIAVTVYPNPTNGQMTIAADFDIHHIEVYDNAGRLILNEVNPSSTLNLYDFARGTYLLKVYANGEQAVLKRIVKQ